MDSAHKGLNETRSYNISKKIKEDKLKIVG